MTPEKQPYTVEWNGLTVSWLLEFVCNQILYYCTTVSHLSFKKLCKILVFIISYSHTESVLKQLDESYQIWSISHRRDRWQNDKLGIMKVWKWLFREVPPLESRRLSEATHISIGNSLQWNGTLFTLCIICIVLVSVGGWIYKQHQKRTPRWDKRNRIMKRKRTSPVDPFITSLSQMGKKLKYNHLDTSQHQVVVTQPPKQRARMNHLSIYVNKNNI